MSTFKKYSLLLAFCSVTACSTASDNYDDSNYYMNDFSMNETQQTAPKKEVKEEKITLEDVKKIQKYNKDSNLTTSTITTEVTKKVADINEQLSKIQANIDINTETLNALKAKNAEESRLYYEHVAQIYARLQIGTTPGNPELTEMQKKAAVLLAESDKNILAITKLAEDNAKTKEELNQLIKTISSAFEISGAMEYDHENLKALEDKAHQTFVTLNRLSANVDAQSLRQNQYHSTETKNAETLEAEIKTGRLAGTKIAAKSIQAPVAIAATSKALSTTNIENRKPLIAIRFNGAEIAYKQQLYQAVKIALEKRPSTDFEVVAVLPATDTDKTVAYATEVYNALLAMGIPKDRVFLSQTQAPKNTSPEVNLYLK